ncbi:MAG: hypothetical protein QOF48_1417 [Verrucomicrobiota bacterium]|jgi:uncharacterized membrane protein YdjX (TVP38/TMEM64 family)
MFKMKQPLTAVGRRRFWLAVLLLCAAGALAVYLKVPTRLQGLSKSALDWLDHLGVWGPVVFVLLYVLACVALVPAAMLTVGAGAVFGVVWGSLLVFVGATLGAGAAFLVSRHVLRGWVTKKLGDRAGFKAIDQAVAEEGWKIVFLTRLAPVFPFFVLNYIYGLTRVRFGPYLLATFFGIMPGSILFVFIGRTARQATSQHSSLMDWLKYGFILATAIVAVVYMGKVARRALARLALPAAARGRPE